MHVKISSLRYDDVPARFLINKSKSNGRVGGAPEESYHCLMTTSHGLVYALRSGSPCLVRRNLYCRFLNCSAGRPQNGNDDPSSSEDKPGSAPHP